MIGLDSIILDDPGIAFHSDQEGVRYWRAESGDIVELWYFDIPPDLPAPPEEIDKVRALYRSRVVETGLAIISIDTVKISECPAVRMIFKGQMPENPRGLMYVASIIIPFRDFSFVLKTICSEHGTTGLRTAVVLAQLMSQGKVKMGTSSELIGWFADPYDPNFRADLLRNLADDEEYDAKFPGHPLSRARRLLRTVEERTTISEEAKRAPRFAGPRPQPHLVWPPRQ